MIGALVLAIIYGICNLWPSSKENEPSATGPESEPAKKSQVATVKPDAGLIDIDLMEKLPWGDDPFRTEKPITAVITHQESRVPLWVLNGIIFNPTRPMAIINKKTVLVGDIIDKATVQSIESKAVILEYQGVNLTLTINKG